MRLLFDQGTAVPLRNHLLDHTVETVYERGWAHFSNGELLARAEAEGFDALVTTDQNLRYQQNLSGRKIGVLVLMTTSWPRVRGEVVRIANAVNNLRPGGYVEVNFP